MSMVQSEHKSILSPETPVHMVGICGAGMSGLAIVMAGMGYRVSGCDLRPGEVGDKLRGLDISVAEGHDPSHLSGAGLVVASAAVPRSDPELEAARSRGMTILSRAEMLGRLMAGRFGVAVSGTHGKTTTTSMIAVVLRAAGLDPTILIGGDLDLLGGNARLGKGDLFVTEACEAYDSFLELRPRLAVITNIEHDHHDWYPTMEDVLRSFRRFLSQIEEGGCAIICADCPNARGIIPDISARVVTYGLSEDAEIRAVDVDESSPDPSFRVEYLGRDLGRFELRVPGAHNIRNALAAIAVACEFEVEPVIMKAAFAGFRGAGRRFDVLGTARGITVVDDYAHHPTEVSATLQAARAWKRRLVAVFQPHLFSRTQALAADFAESLRAADEVVLTEIYPAREKPMPGVSAKMIADMINSADPGKARFVSEKDRLADDMLPRLKSGDLVVFMGAGDIRESAEELASRLSGGRSTQYARSLKFGK